MRTMTSPRFQELSSSTTRLTHREGGYWGAPPRRANCFPAALAAAICWARTASTCIGLPYADAAEVGPREGSTDIGWGEGGTRAIDELEEPTGIKPGTEAGVGGIEAGFDVDFVFPLGSTVCCTVIGAAGVAEVVAAFVEVPDSFFFGLGWRTRRRAIRLPMTEMASPTSRWVPLIATARNVDSPCR